MAVALALAAVDLAASRALRSHLSPVALVFAGLSAAAGVVGGLAVGIEGPLGESWTATAALAVAGAAAVTLTRLPRPDVLLPFPVPVSAVSAAVGGLALTGSL